MKFFRLIQGEEVASKDNEQDSTQQTSSTQPPRRNHNDLQSDMLEGMLIWLQTAVD